jgi:hypothetical protein
MKSPSLRFASAVGLIISVCMSTGVNGRSADPELQEIAGYRQWHKLTEKPIVVEWSVPSG